MELHFKMKNQAWGHMPIIPGFRRQRQEDRYDYEISPAQRLGALTALPEVRSSIPSNQMVAHNHL